MDLIIKIPASRRRFIRVWLSSHRLDCYLFLCFVFFAGCVIYGVRRLMLRPISILRLTIFSGVAFGGGVWALLPYLTYEMPPVAANWSSDYYGHLLRDRYPDHLLNPAWF